ncbi:Trimethylguanosine synthase [Entomophthora muscae]|uniref:Trimethylguanosine synthase n=1 Tax=Entomophthora muscae TaxID=34485 RepID=A0ACC2TAR2_9FUNG|nr:Trimethylguanosine synthase [Entomophthora muscae]
MLEITQYDEDIESHKDKIVCGLRKTLPPYLLKYWRNRYNLFSRYNEGCLIDEEGWFSVTPELVARQIATRMACDVIIDAFCGVGGNSIQFAHTCKKVIAIDNNPTRLAFAKHNAKRMPFSFPPPWGGPAYNTVPTFDIHTMMPFSGVRLFKLCASITPNIGYFLPRNTDYNQLACLATPIGNCEVEEAYSSHKFIAITAYYGKIVS